MEPNVQWEWPPRCLNQMSNQMRPNVQWERAPGPVFSNTGVTRKKVDAPLGTKKSIFRKSNSRDLKPKDLEWGKVSEQ